MILNMAVFWDVAQWVNRVMRREALVNRVMKTGSGGRLL
jgi:hypothetical protein